MTLRIGSNLTLPIDAVTQTFAILAKRGAGKSYTASVIAEEMLKNGQQVVVIDPTGAWFGLRSSADGKRDGYPIVVMGGDHGDIPLEEHAGGVIASAIVEHGFSAVLDLSLFRKRQIVRFMTDFAEVLYLQNRRAMSLIVDEADAVAPQRPQHEEARMLGAMEDIVRRGRRKGIGCVLITQRPAVLNKNVLTQCEVLVTLRLTHARDIDPIREWVNLHGEPEQAQQLISSLPSLPIGTAWFWSPGWQNLFVKVKVRPRETFDSGATPKSGEVLKAPKKLAAVDLTTLGEKIAATAVAAKANDPKALKNQVVELTALVEKLKSAAPEVKIERIEVPIIPDAQIRVLQEASSAIAQAVETIREICAKYAPNMQIKTINVAIPKVWPTPERPSSTKAPSPKLIPGKISVARESDVSLKAGERKILQTLAQRHPVKYTRSQIGVLTRYKTSGGTFNNYFGNLKRNGLLIEVNGEISITKAGLDYVGTDVPPQPQTTAELLAMWGSVLKAGERKILDILHSVYPNGLSKDELGDMAGFTTSGGTFGNYIGTLRRNGLIVTQGPLVYASEALFID